MQILKNKGAKKGSWSDAIEAKVALETIYSCINPRAGKHIKAINTITLYNVKPLWSLFI